MGNRLRQVSKRDASPAVLKIYQELFGDRDPVAQSGTATGTPGDYWTTYALVPEILTMSRDSLMAMLAPGRPLEARYRELAILRAGIVGDSRFEYSQHMKVARMDVSLGAASAFCCQEVHRCRDRRMGHMEKYLPVSDRCRLVRPQVRADVQ